MASPTETRLHVPADPEGAASASINRRAAVDDRQTRVAELLRLTGCDGLLAVEPENLAWLSAGGWARGVLDRAETPALYFTPEQRWLLAPNHLSQRLFDEELDGLGFQLKEWPWAWGRAQLLTDLVQGKKVASDRPNGSLVDVRDRLARLRRVHGPYQQACLVALGGILAHAVEAAARTLEPGHNEREVAGQIAHRLMHRGALPLHVGVAADGRSALYRVFGYTSATVGRHAVLLAAARKYGLCAALSRTVCFGPPDPALRDAHVAAAKVAATYVAATWPDAVPREVLAGGRRVFQIVGHEHEWRQSPQGHVTGPAPVELPLTPDTEELLLTGWAVTWAPTVAAAQSCDTFLVTDEGPRLITPVEAWPVLRIRVQGNDVIRPDILHR